MGTTNKALIFAAVAEAVTGLALLIVPSLVGQLLLGEELSGIAVPVARVAGIALIGLGVACWPGPPLVGMLTYTSLVALYLAYLGFRSRVDRHPAVAGGRHSRDTGGALDAGSKRPRDVEEQTAAAWSYPERRAEADSRPSALRGHHAMSDSGP